MENTTQKANIFSSYSRWSPDIVAGVSIAGLLLPEAVAYSSIASLPPQAGVIALFSGLISYGLLGRSRFAIVSATSSSAAVMAAATAAMAEHDMTLRIALSVGLIVLTGVFFMLASLAKLGGISDFIAKPVLRGFAFGLSLVIIIKQLPKIVGITSHHSEFLRFTFELFSRADEWNWYGIITTLLSLILLFVLSKTRRMPSALIVIALGIGTNQWLDLTGYGIKLVGPIQLALEKPSLPTFDYIQWRRLAELAVAMVLILYAETFGSIQTYAIKHGDTTSPNRDLCALGLANMASGLLQGLPVGAGFSATTANEAAGAQSRLSGWICSGVVLVIVLTLLPQIALTPEPVLAAIVIYAVSHSLSFRSFRLYFDIRRDRIVAVASMLCVLLFGVLDGLFAGVAMSLAMMLRRWSASSVSVLGRINTSHDFASVGIHPDAKQLDGILIIRPEEPLFFANVARILQEVQQAISTRDQLHTIILSMEESPDLDSTTIEALLDFAKIIEHAGQKLIFVRLKDSAKEVLQRTSIEKLSNSLLLDLSVDTAVTIAAEQELHR